MWNPLGSKVQCKICGKRYLCHQDADYYNSTGPWDGVCETCLLEEAGITEIFALKEEPRSPFSVN